MEVSLLVVEEVVFSSRVFFAEPHVRLAFDMMESRLDLLVGGGGSFYFGVDVFLSVFCSFWLVGERGMCFV